MYLNPRLARLLESYEPERLKALLMWFNAEQQSLQNQSQRLSAILEEAHIMDADACYHSASHLKLKDMVEVSILNEFGPDFGSKPFFPWLAHAVSARFSV